MSLLTVEQMKSANGIKFQDVEAWGGTVRVRSMTSEMQDVWFRWVNRNRKPGVEPDYDGLRRFMCALCMVDEDGKALFVTPENATIDQKMAAVAELSELFREKDAVTCDAIHEAAAKLNGLRKDDVEDRAKN